MPRLFNSSKLRSNRFQHYLRLKILCLATGPNGNSTMQQSSRQMRAGNVSIKLRSKRGMLEGRIICPTSSGIVAFRPTNPEA